MVVVKIHILLSFCRCEVQAEQKHCNDNIRHLRSQRTVKSPYSGRSLQRTTLHNGYISQQRMKVTVKQS